MPVETLQSLLVTVLFILPGGLGIALRDYFWPSRRRSPYQEVLSALAGSVFALMLLDGLTGLIGLATPSDVKVGDYVLGDLISGRLSLSPVAFWTKYLFYFVVALALPPLGAKLLRTKFALKRLKEISLYHFAFDAIFEEIWEGAEKGATPWVTVLTSDERDLQGYVAWRSTGSMPPQLILGDVLDVTDPDQPITLDGLVLLPNESITRLRVHPSPEESKEKVDAEAERADY